MVKSADDITGCTSCDAIRFYLAGDWGQDEWLTCSIE
jgi:hypothetical protein